MVLQVEEELDPRNDNRRGSTAAEKDRAFRAIRYYDVHNIETTLTEGDFHRQRERMPEIGRNPPCDTLFIDLPAYASQDTSEAMFSTLPGYKRLCFYGRQNKAQCFVEFNNVEYATQAMKELRLHPPVEMLVTFATNSLGAHYAPRGEAILEDNAETTPLPPGAGLPLTPHLHTEHIGRECAVCKEPLEYTLRSERILQLSCGHVSHESCFYEYIQEFESQHCPTCNATLSLDTSRGGSVLDLSKCSVDMASATLGTETSEVVEACRQGVAQMGESQSSKNFQANLRAVLETSVWDSDSALEEVLEPGAESTIPSERQIRDVERQFPQYLARYDGFCRQLTESKSAPTETQRMNLLQMHKRLEGIKNEIGSEVSVTHPSDVLSKHISGGNLNGNSDEENRHDESRVSGKADDRPWPPDIEQLYEEFLKNEKLGSTLESFPAGSLLHIADLTGEVTKRDIWSRFLRHGKLAYIFCRPTDAFVQFSDPGSAQKAFNAQQGSEFNGKEMHLEIAKPGSKAGNHKFRGLFADTPWTSSDAPAKGVDPPEVLFLAESLFEFHSDDDRQEGGIPYLKYVPGEVFDVVGMKGELWLARNQNDTTKTIGWIWEKHFVRILPEEINERVRRPLRTADAPPEEEAEEDGGALTTEGHTESQSLTSATYIAGGESFGPGVGIPPFNTSTNERSGFKDLEKREENQEKSARPDSRKISSKKQDTVSRTATQASANASLDAAMPDLLSPSMEPLPAETDTTKPMEQQQEQSQQDVNNNWWPSQKEVFDHLSKRYVVFALYNVFSGADMFLWKSPNAQEWPSNHR